MRGEERGGVGGRRRECGRGVSEEACRMAGVWGREGGNIGAINLVRVINRVVRRSSR